MLFNCLVILTPTAPDVMKFMMLNLGGWNIGLMSTEQVLHGIIGSVVVIYMLYRIKNKEYNIIMALGTIIRALSGILNSQLVLYETMPLHLGFFLVFIQQLCINVSDGLLLSSIQSRLSEIIPKGFESTGIAITSLIHFFRIGSYQIDKFQMRRYSIRKGYYSRIQPMLITNILYSLVLTVVSPAFIGFK